MQGFFLCLGENDVLGLDQSNLVVADYNCLIAWENLFSPVQVSASMWGSGKVI